MVIVKKLSNNLNMNIYNLTYWHKCVWYTTILLLKENRKAVYHIPRRRYENGLSYNKHEPFIHLVRYIVDAIKPAQM